MAKLIFSLENTILNEYQLDKERTTIGRRPTNDIQIDNLAVSGEHAAIIKMGEDFYIEDQSSTNGTQVNDKIVKSHLLHPGDLIQFGKFQLKYINEAALSSDAKDGGGTDFEKTMMIRPSAMKAMTQAQPTHTPVIPAVPPAPISHSDQPSPVTSSTSSTGERSQIVVGRIQVLNGSSAGRELVLNKALTTLGKTGVQVAVITRRQNGYFITHVEGKVFPIVNGESTGSQAFSLSDHDVIELAGVKMEFYLDKS
ncbi:MAG: FHA domain-containing protein [Methylotenera sp.]|nr:FHA domain-containing protein [Methylotenera sp.]